MATDPSVLRVLLVEDNPGDAVLVRETLSDVRSPTFALDWRRTLEEAIATLGDSAVDAVLLDLSLPRTWGIDTLHRLVAARPEVPVVILSGLDDAGTAMAALQSGAQDYLVKGRFDGPLLARALRYAIERKRARDEIETLASELETRVERRTAELAAANAELGALLHSLTHDLRTPLRSIHGFAELLLDEYREQLDGDGRDYLQRMVGASERIETVLDALLELSGTARSPLRWDRFDLSAVARRVADEQRRIWSGRTVDVQIEPRLETAGDPRLMRVVLGQLITNGFKFTRDTADPRIEVGRVDDAFFVRDNGVGFDMAFADNLFKPFQRLHADQGYEGIGIGLATAARIVQRHGGRLWAEGSPGSGCTFWFTLGAPAD